MRTISQALSGGKKKTATFANQIDSEPTTEKSTPDMKRVDKKELEAAYRKQGLAFNSVNKITQMIMSGAYSINGAHSQFYNDFLNSIGEVGTNEHWDEVQEQIFRYQCIYGDAFVEIVLNKARDKVTDLVLLDPKKIDYATTSSNDIALDKYGNPYGYVQKLPSGMMRDIENKYEPPEEVTLSGSEIYIPRENIAHYKLYTVGEGFYGIGLIEPVFTDAENLHGLKEDYGDKAHSTLFPLRYAKVGDERHEPSPEEIKQILERLKEAKDSTVMSIPNHVDLGLLEPSQPGELISFLDYFGDNQTAGMGIPKAFASGSGEEVNRATLDKFNQLFELTLRDIVKRTNRTTEKAIFGRIAELEGFDEYPTIEWGDIGVEESVNKADRLIRYVKSGILEPDDERVQKVVKDIDDI